MRNWSSRSIVATIVLVMGMTVALPASAMSDGTVDDSDEFPFVAIAIQFTSDGAFFCSAGAIDEYHLVTAAHCFQDLVPPEFGGPANAPVPGIQIRYGVDAFAPDEVVTGTWYPDDWCPACGNGLPGFDSKDLAIIKVDFPVPLPEYISLPTERVQRHAAKQDIRNAVWLRSERFHSWRWTASPRCCVRPTRAIRTRQI